MWQIPLRIQSRIQSLTWFMGFLFFWDAQCVREKRKPINQVNFSENCNDSSEKIYLVTKFSLSSFFWHQIQDALALHDRARTISNSDVKKDLRRMGIQGLNGVCHVSEQRDVVERHSLAFLLSLLSCFFCLGVRLCLTFWGQISVFKHG